MSGLWVAVDVFRERAALPVVWSAACRVLS